MSIAKAKPRLPSEIFAFKAENTFSERKRHRQTPIYASAERKRIYRPKTALGKAKARLPSENIACKVENAFSEQKLDNRVNAWLAKAKTPLESEIVARKGENAFIER